VAGLGDAKWGLPGQGPPGALGVPWVGVMQAVTGGQGMDEEQARKASINRQEPRRLLGSSDGGRGQPKPCLSRIGRRIPPCYHTAPALLSLASHQHTNPSSR
jgi:hypothetical protein